MLRLINTAVTRVYHIGSGVASSVHDVALDLAILLDADHDLISLAPPDPEHPPDVPLPLVSPQQTISLLGRRPLPLSEGLAHAFKTYGGL